jgi:hypothetical protein
MKLFFPSRMLTRLATITLLIAAVRAEAQTYNVLYW